MTRTVLFLAAVALIVLCGAGWESAETAEMKEKISLAANGKTTSSETADGNAEGFLIKWKGGPSAAFFAVSRILREMEEMDVVIALPKPGVSLHEWLNAWTDDPRVEYVQPNQKVRLFAVPNDPFLKRQTYLQEIGANAVWEIGKLPGQVVVAVVDTGVDLNHPDLKKNLLPGVNLLKPGQPPRDDNGHGTNVAGIIAAAANNGEGIAGIGRNVKILPIKALNGDGSGSEDKLGEGIRYAVDHGAKVIVLSLGLYHDSPFMREIVEYAEKKGVLLVAAAGNEGREVKYPAAYPTVLAVGGSANRVPVSRSNFGPEIDLVAPWKVYTTAVGGKYTFNEGTSMAAPQVAAAAALVLSKYPDWKPYQVRNFLRQTAEDLGAPGWDPRTGYGLLRIDRILKNNYIADMYEPNNRIGAAKPFPLQSMVVAELNGNSDLDWYVIDVPYDGKLEIKILDDSGKRASVRLTHFDSPSSKGKDYLNQGQTDIILNVKKGKHYLRISKRTPDNRPLPYRLISTFRINADPFEDNDRMYKAVRLPVREQEIRGTFHQKGDEDWFELHFSQEGNLRVKLSPDTARMDGVLLIQRQGEKPIIVDEMNEGGLEYKSVHVFPGKYFVRVKNVHENPVVGTYGLFIDFVPKLTDPNEPNDKPYQAVLLAKGKTYRGLFHSAKDEDWFAFTLKQRSLAEFSLTVPPGHTVTAVLKNEKLTNLQTRTNAPGVRTIRFSRELGAGTYYLQVTSRHSFEDRMYELNYTPYVLVEGFKDISSHWAKTYIAELSRRNIVRGYGNYAFLPDQSISRAEAAAMLAQALGLRKQIPLSYRDVSPNHWAYAYINRATAAGFVEGAGSRKFEPDRPLTRMEMAVMLANALQIRGSPQGRLPFSDISPTYWGTPILRALAGKGLIAGYGDGTFRPQESATRAEFAVVIYGLMKKK